jgi:hypothetical protein
MYKLPFLLNHEIGKGEYIIRISDNTHIPFSLENRDYQKYLQWLEKGNTPLPADPLPEEDK